jgi:hypothetical protein
VWSGKFVATATSLQQVLNQQACLCGVAATFDAFEDNEGTMMDIAGRW